jgi:uncharacterized protein (TIGR00369 family)
MKNPRGLKTPFHLHEKGAYATFTPDVSHSGYEDVVHGGIVSALLDEAIIWAVYAGCRIFAVTAELKIRFRRPMLLGESYKIQGTVLEHGGRIIQAESVILDGSGNMIARARGKVVRSKEKNESLSE